MENIVKSKASVYGLPFNFFRAAVDQIIFGIAHRPVFIVFLCTWITTTYLLLFNQRAQEIVASLPYGRYFAKFKSRKMITIYVTILEVVVEVLMAVIFAGVSMLITFWLLFEEVTDRKKRMKLDVVEDEEFLCSNDFKIPILEKKN